MIPRFAAAGLAALAAIICMFGKIPVKQTAFRIAVCITIPAMHRRMVRQPVSQAPVVSSAIPDTPVTVLHVFPTVPIVPPTMPLAASMMERPEPIKDASITSGLQREIATITTPATAAALPAAVV
jgi:hypothetical protein